LTLLFSLKTSLHSFVPDQLFILLWQRVITDNGVGGHGGNIIRGSSDDSVALGNMLVSKGVVVVSFNCYLGLFDRSASAFNRATN